MKRRDLWRSALALVASALFLLLAFATSCRGADPGDQAGGSSPTGTNTTVGTGGGACVPNSGRLPGGFRVDVDDRTIPLFIRYPEGATGPTPVVIFSHGGGTEDDPSAQSVCWARVLARAGYVVISVAHTALGSNYLTMCAAYGIDCNGGSFGMTAVLRAHDLRAVIDDLDCIEAAIQAKAGSALTLDRDAIALSGWSAGSWGTEVLGGADQVIVPSDVHLKLPDPRPKALLLNSPPGPNARDEGRGFFCTPSDADCCVPGAGAACSPGWESTSSWRDITVPSMLLTGEGDCADAIGIERRASFAGFSSADKYLVDIVEGGACMGDLKTGTCSGCFAEHNTFNIYGGDMCNGDGELLPPGNAPGDTLRFGATRLLTSGARAFLDAYLRGSAAAQDYLASDRLEVLSQGFVSWPGDASKNGACTKASDPACVYSSPATYPVGEIGTPHDAASYYFVHTDSY